ncbi:unnamed protein product [Prorocentrum cordatum]|uniref:Uncharacterized protein n=1 Tax=Prorocentrum cordatum TaxID=2364126 RepID=A0ABN9VP46_9DINO|nr:unnamed protein product [Polarella glacialis]
MVSLSSDGSRVAIGAHGNDGAGSNSGHVRVFGLSGNTWSQVGQDIDGEASDDASGMSVSLSSDGSRVAIGAGYNDDAGTNFGHVRVYGLSGNTWSQVGQDIDGEASGGSSGWSVSLSSDGSRVAIGAGYNDGAGTNSGHVRVYGLSGNTWSQVGQDIDGEAGGDMSGVSVSLSSDGSRVAIGAHGNDGAGSTSGHVRVFGTEASTPAPTPAPTLAPTPAPTTSSSSATGNPHLQNMFGQRFDLARPGTSVLVSVPRGTSVEDALLVVKADARRLGAHCSDMYFQEVNATGAWANKVRPGGFHFDALDARDETPKWLKLGLVELKIGSGHTDKGQPYLNVYVKNLQRTGYRVGGLLGEDDHTEAAAPEEGCQKMMSLQARVYGQASDLQGSVAIGY